MLPTVLGHVPGLVDYAGLWNCFVTLLQVCSAGSRLIVEDTVAERVIGKIRERMTHLRVGDSLDKVREGEREREGYVETWMFHWLVTCM